MGGTINIDAAFVKKALRWRYSNTSQIAMEWIVIFEVGINTGVPGRFIDAVAFNCWQSKGFKKIAFEIKVSRGDFLREIRDPLKRVPALIFFDEFYFVAPSGVIPKDEVPRDCGLMEVGQSGQIQVRLKPNAYGHEAAPLTNGMLMSVIRNAYKQGFVDGSERVQMDGPDELYKIMQKDFQYMRNAIEAKKPVAYAKSLHQMALQFADLIKNKGLLEDRDELFEGL
jgi:hypothetical protein